MTTRSRIDDVGVEDAVVADARAAPDDDVRVNGGPCADRRAGLDHDERDRSTRSAPITASVRDRAERIDCLVAGWCRLREQADRLRKGRVGIAAAQQRAGGREDAAAVECFADDDRGCARGGELGDWYLGLAMKVRSPAPACSMRTHPQNLDVPVAFEAAPQAFGEIAELQGGIIRIACGEAEGADGVAVRVDEVDAGAILRTALGRDLERRPGDSGVEAQRPVIVGQRHAHPLVRFEHRRRDDLRPDLGEVDEPRRIPVEEHAHVAGDS